MTAALYFLIGIAGIGIMIIIHEIGHFIMARILRIDVDVVSFGFGPAWFKWGKKRTYRLGVIPYGGFCRMKGEDDLRRALQKKEKLVENAEDGSIYAAGPFKRLLVYIAGPVFNIFFAALLFFILLMLPVETAWSDPVVVLALDYPEIYPNANPSAYESGMRTGMRVSAVNGERIETYEQFLSLLSVCKEDPWAVITADGKDYRVSPSNGVFGIAQFIEPLVSTVTPDSPEWNAGLRSQDIILSINGSEVTNMCDILAIRAQNPEEINMKFKRGSSEKTTCFKTGGEWNIGFTLHVRGKAVRPYTVGTALKMSFGRIHTIVKTAFSSLISSKNVKETVAGTFTASTSIGEMTTSGFSENFSKGMRTALYLLAGVSVSIGIANLLPVPSLDGGLIILSVVELIRGKDASPKFYVIAQVVGILIVFGLLLLIALS